MTTALITTAALALAATVGFAAPAAAETPDVPIRATYNTASQRYCVRPTTLQEATAIGTGLYQRECLTARQWRLRSVSFASALPAERVASR